MDTLFKEQVKQFPIELKLLLSLINEEQTIDKLSPDLLEKINWDTFYTLTIHHRVFPIVYKKIKELDSEFVPEFVCQKLKLSYQKNIFRMLFLSGETENVAKLFDKNNIRSLFLKGTVLAVDLYGDVSLRTSADIDILIPIEKLSLAEKLLLDHGYIKDDYIETVLNDWKWRHHHITFSHPEKQIKVEIHWRLNPGPAKEPNFNDLWDRKRVSKLTSYPVYTLGFEDLFLFLVSHGARHGWSRLRWLMDIEKLVKMELNWNKTKDLLRENQFLQLGGQALYLASELLCTKVPDEMMENINRKQTKQLAGDALFYIKQMVNLHTYPVPKDVSEYHKRHLISLMSKRQKVLFFASTLYPYPEDAEFFPLPKILHFLYFPLRPIIVILRKTKNYSEARRA
ncbi:MULTISPECIES: nucleotidyltransferase domain-containing protein [Bacillaceae]|uniref:nucleotidyltransferase domain-containing protein n=1 Tax=Bacillaceae TaxID=186817 RepID=UPI002FFF0C73